MSKNNLMPTRRTVVRTAVWTAPAVSLAVASPAFANSNPSPSATLASPTVSNGVYTVSPVLTAGSAPLTVLRATFTVSFNGTPGAGKFLPTVAGSGWSGGANGNASSGIYTPSNGSVAASGTMTMPAIDIDSKGNTVFNTITVVFEWTDGTVSGTTTASVTFVP
ncbi:hypothetical protein [Nocardioides piscis]|uniref:Uncharacterized protein n=1 Tax=Nocardioides piscis TaxID=2714938 RepID=A0A6G7YF38_9ACTN|nr:hypothetical protein [Nocardioides piscis]QIK75227.1 hypothetical protein G7071_07095 [Nocardioides piscis]